MFVFLRSEIKMLDIVDCFAGGILAKLASFISSSSRIPLTEHWEY